MPGWFGDRPAEKIAIAPTDFIWAIPKAGTLNLDIGGLSIISWYGAAPYCLVLKLKFRLPSNFVLCL